MPILVKKVAGLVSRVKKGRTKQKLAAPKKKKKTEIYIDSPQHTRKHFNKLNPQSKKQEKVESAEPRKPKQKRHIKRVVKVYVKAHKRVFLAASIGFLGILLVVAITTLNGNKQVKKSGEVAGASTQVAAPTFEPLVSKTETKQKIKFDTTREVASYEDKIGGVRVVVSQQKLAEKDRVDPNFLSRTATAFNLKTDMTTKKGQAYTGVNIEKNTQFTMFVYKDFLVFIQGDESVKNQLIVDYIDSLE